MNNKSKPMVSVVMITYMHEAFIAEAIEGVLMQEVDFDVELIIADDCSPDGTEEIVQHYIDTHTNGSWIKYNRHYQNIGMIPNFLFALKKAKGKYIALCDGDDYWTNSKKLSEQVAFLEIHQDCSAFMHKLKVKLEYEHENSDISFYTLGNSTGYYTEKDVVQFNIDGTASIVFRKDRLFPYPDFFEKTKNGDTTLFLILATRGKIYYSEETMGVYRKHQGGVTNSDKFSKLNYFLETNKMLLFADQFTNHLYHKEILESKIRLLRWTGLANKNSAITNIKLRILTRYYHSCISLFMRMNIKPNKYLKL